MGGKSCFFIGHREASEEIYPALYAAVEQHILEYGVTEFIVGHYGGFDRLAASAVKEAKRFHPEVKLTLLLPYHPAERPIPKPDGFDSTYYPPGMENVPRKVAIFLDDEVSLQYYRVQKIFEGSIALEQSEPLPNKLHPGKPKPEEEKAPLSELIDKINEKFGTEFTNIDKVLEQIVSDMDANEELRVQARNNSQEHFRFPFNDAFMDVVSNTTVLLWTGGENIRFFAAAGLPVFRKTSAVRAEQQKTMQTVFGRFSSGHRNDRNFPSESPSGEPTALCRPLG